MVSVSSSQSWITDGSWIILKNHTIEQKNNSGLFCSIQSTCPIQNKLRHYTDNIVDKETVISTVICKLVWYTKKDKSIKVHKLYVCGCNKVGEYKIKNQVFRHLEFISCLQ